MNRDQEAALTALAARTPGHGINDWVTPMTRGVACPCGWTWSLRRAGRNALAVKSMAFAAGRKHLLDVIARAQEKA